MNRQQVINLLTECGIWVKNGKIAKADLNKAVAAVASLKTEAASKKVELTSKPNREEVSNGWPDNVVYNGKNVFKTVYKDSNFKMLKKEAADLNDNFGGFHFTPTLEIQECYLGYSPSADKFVMGFDAWYYTDSGVGDEMNCALYVEFKIDGGSVDIHDSDVAAHSEDFYSEGYERIKRKYSDIIDIRLD